MSAMKHATIETNGIQMHVVEQGQGPLVMLCHGFPESWYSWRHQLPALASAGFRAVAPDMRGYGQSERPEETSDAYFYQLYFQKPGLAESEAERDPRTTIRTILYTLSGEGSGGAFVMVPRNGGVLSRLTNPEKLPVWITEQDIDFYAGEFKRTGFRGGLNWYRNIDLNWELLAPYAGSQVTVPALYIAGNRDIVVSFKGMDQLLANLTKFVPKLRKQIMLQDCGHWTQQERPQEVNEALIGFLREL